MNNLELQDILKLHEKWVNDEPDGIRADLSGANLIRADLIRANLSGANLSGATGILSAIDFLEKNFEKTEDGYIAYKTFGSFYRNSDWDTHEGSIITENADFGRTFECGCGINVATLPWVKEHTDEGAIWKVLIRWEWLCGVCVPYMSDGKIRCERVELLETVARNSASKMKRK